MTVRTAVWACWFLCVLVLYQNLPVRIMLASKLPSVTGKHTDINMRV